LSFNSLSTRDVGSFLGTLGTLARGAMSQVLFAVSDLLGLRLVRSLDCAPTFVWCLALGAAFLCILPHLVALEPLPWHRIASASFLLAVVWQPIVEELVFRGRLQGFLSSPAWGRQTFVGVSIANLLTSVLFAMAHTATHPLMWAYLTFIPSLLFGIVRDRSGSVYPPIALHIIYNGGYFLLTGGSSLI
jgi:membrane protease YdiL (CAAX protease family)